MNGYSVLLLTSAQRDLKSFSDADLQTIRSALEEMQGEPRGTSTKKLKTTKGYYSKRVGSFRIIFQIADEGKQVVVHRVGDRKDVYKNL